LHNALDTVIAALTTRAAAWGLATRPDPKRETAARTESWIAPPISPPSELA